MAWMFQPQVPNDLLNMQRLVVPPNARMVNPDRGLLVPQRRKIPTGPLTAEDQAVQFPGSEQPSSAAASAGSPAANPVRDMIINSMKQYIDKMNAPQKPWQKGAAAGQWAFGNIVAPLVAAIGGPGTAQAGVEMMQQAQATQRQDKLSKQEKEKEYIGALAQLGGLLNKFDNEDIKSLANDTKAQNLQSRLEIAQQRADIARMTAESMAALREQQASESAGRTQRREQLTPLEVLALQALAEQRGASTKNIEAKTQTETKMLPGRIEAQKAKIDYTNTLKGNVGKGKAAKPKAPTLTEKKEGERAQWYQNIDAAMQAGVPLDEIEADLRKRTSGKWNLKSVLNMKDKEIDLMKRRDKLKRKKEKNG